MYKLIKDNVTDKIVSIKRIADNAFIPSDNANSDFVQFKKDLADGAELQDSKGVIMTEEQVNQFIETLS